jgi:hypothetical protein
MKLLKETQIIVGPEIKEQNLTLPHDTAVMRSNVDFGIEFQNRHSGNLTMSHEQTRRPLPWIWRHAPFEIGIAC